MKRKILLFPMLLLLTCGEMTPEMDMTEEYKHWMSKGIHNYSIEQRRDCFCPNGGVDVRVTVKSDAIKSVIRISDSSVETHPYYLTVDSLFGIISAGNYDSIVVRFNDEYGYPEFVDVDPQNHPVDGGYLYTTTKLVVLK